MTKSKFEGDRNHDEVVLFAVRKLPRIAEALGIVFASYQLEYEIEPLEYQNHNAFSCFVDVALLDEADLPVLTLEIKSSKEIHQSTFSAMFRQVRQYRRRLGVPCVLVFDQKLPAYGEQYLKCAEVAWFNAEDV